MIPKIGYLLSVMEDVHSSPVPQHRDLSIPVDENLYSHQEMLIFIACGLWESAGALTALTTDTPQQHFLGELKFSSSQPTPPHRGVGRYLSIPQRITSHYQHLSQNPQTYLFIAIQGNFYFIYFSPILNTTSSLFEPMRKGGPQRERPCDTQT